MEKLCLVDKVHHISGVLNVADLATRGGVKLCDLGPDSLWQKGPDFLSCRRERWQVSRDFMKVNSDIPDQELRIKKINQFATLNLSGYELGIYNYV